MTEYRKFVDTTLHNRFQDLNLDMTDSYEIDEGRTYSFGTAGFREIASILPPVMYRVGIISTLYSVHSKSAYVGLMITASHNPPHHNGIKIVETNGEHLNSEWEQLAGDIMTVPLSGLKSHVHQLCKEKRISFNNCAKIIIGYDTRSSCPVMLDAIKNGIKFSGISTQLLVIGLCTTPQIHYLTARHNSQVKIVKICDYPKLFVDAYLEYFSFLSSKIKISYEKKICVDVAHGSGSMLMKNLKLLFPESFQPFFVCNDEDDPEKLNCLCGADYVKTLGIPPKDIPQDYFLYASFDGDSDRVVFYYFDKEKKFHLLDGDKIAILLLSYILNLVKELPQDIRDRTKIGLVQTLYSNSASSKFATSLGIPVNYAATGVKNLHRIAKSFDIGIYFEANGHGMILFREQYIASLDSIPLYSAKRLYLLSKLMNQQVGDSLSILLTVYLILQDLKITPSVWDSYYKDIPSCLNKISVPSRNLIKTTENHSEVLNPKGLQKEITKICGEYQESRAFVRSSGTENVIRIFSEARMMSDAIELNKKIEDAVMRYI